MVEKLSKKELFQRAVEKGAEQIVSAIQFYGGFPDDDENFRQTPERVGRAYVEILGGMFDDGAALQKVLSAKFPYTAMVSEMVVVGPVHVWSMCPHHLLPVEMDVWVGYMPKKYVLGLSKLARVAELLARKPGLQETVTTEIVEALDKGLETYGAACQIRGRHLCMSMRGVKNDARTTTTQLRGSFLEQTVRAEFLAAVRADISNGKV